MIGPAFGHATGLAKKDADFRPGDYISAKAFIRGLTVGFVLLLCLAVWLRFTAPAAIQAEQDRLASVIVPVDQGTAPARISLANADTDRPAAPPETYVGHAAAPMTSNPVALPDAPIEGLYVATPTGTLPIIDQKTRRTPFQAYRRPFDRAAAGNKPMISLIVTDLGLSQAASKATVTDLPPEISFAISPYAGEANSLVKDSRAKGHEVWLVMPMQTASYPRTDPGPHTLLTGVPAKENLKKLDWLMAQATGYVGFISSYSPDFLNSQSDSAPVLDGLYARGLAFADTAAARPDVGLKNAARPEIHADMWFDRGIGGDEIDSNLNLLEGLASRNGHAVGVIPALPLNYPRIRAWIASMQSRGYVLAPLSAQAAQ